jgi:hypothetical protein
MNNNEHSATCKYLDVCTSSQSQLAAKWIQKMAEVEAFADEERADQTLSAWMGEMGEMGFLVPDLPPADCLSHLIKFCKDAEVEAVTWKHISTLVTFLSGVNEIDGQLQKVMGNPFIIGSLEETAGFGRCCAKLTLQAAATNVNTCKIRMDTLLDARDEASQMQVLNMTSERPWEASDRPWLLFNTDGSSMTFLGFTVDQAGMFKNADGSTGPRIMSKSTRDFLCAQQQALKQEILVEDLDKADRHVLLETLWIALGGAISESVHDPNPDFKLADDLMKKSLAIAQRWSVGLSVIIQGTTG